ncbi:MAG: hypothetical protein IIV79_03600, partial [Clostridia bacterium]|nr:hypothetical protein [Clostridia bacterium]
GILESIRRAKQLHKTIHLCLAIQQLSTLFGLILTVAGMLISPGNLSWIWFLAFNVLWALPAVAVSLFKKD